MPRSKEHTLNALKGILDDLYSSTVSGVRDQLELYADTGHLHRTNTKRQIARDHIVDRLRTVLDGKDDIRIKDENQTTYFLLKSEYKVLVKKTDEDGTVQLTKSQMSFEFQANEEQIAFDNNVIPELTNLYLGYVPNLQEPRSPAVFLVCPSKTGHHWLHELEPSSAFLAGEIGQQTTPDGSAEEELVRVPAKPKAKVE